MLNKDKTKVTHIGSGIDFGVSYPTASRQNILFSWKEKSQKLLEMAWLKETRAPPENVIHLNPIIRGIGNFYRIGAAKEQCPTLMTKSEVALESGTSSTTPEKGCKWGRRNTIAPTKGVKVHSSPNQDRRGLPRYIYLTKASAIQYSAMWKLRILLPRWPTCQILERQKSKYGKSHWTEGNPKVAEKQKWKCPVCGEHLFNEEKHTTKWEWKIHTTG